MTLATESTYEFTVDRLVLRAHQLASLMGADQAPTGIQWEARARMAREFLEGILKALQAEGKLIRMWNFYELSVVDGTADYVLPGTILDVFEDAMYIDPASPYTETPIKQIDLQMWQRLAIRNASGRPVQYYAHRADGPLEIRFWPTPEESATVRLQAYYLPANVTDGTKTVQLERHWGMYLMYALATELAESANLNRSKINALRQRSLEELARAKGYSHQRTKNQAIVTHWGGIRGWRT